MDEGKKAFGRLLIAGRDPAVALELVEEALDHVALFVQTLGPVALDLAIALWGDDR
jgi:hypothetical protein